jgi:drug/metabolite transporter (DMT)-like permease
MAAPVRGIVALMLPCTLFWGAIFVCGKLAVQEGDPLVVATLRFIVALLVLVPLTLWREPRALRLTRQDLPWAFSLGLTGVAAYNGLVMLGLQWAPASDGAMITPTLNPLLTVLMAAVLFRESLTRNKLLGLGLAFGGVICVSAGAPATQAAGSMRLWGDLLFIGGAVAWSAYTLIGRAVAGRYSALVSTTLASLFGTLLLLPFSWRGLGALNWTALSPGFWASVLVLGILSTVVAFWLWHEAIHHYGASRAASFLPLNPVFGVLMAMWLLGEHLAAMQWVGMALAVAGVVIAIRPPTATLLPAVDQNEISLT